MERNEWQEAGQILMERFIQEDCEKVATKIPYKLFKTLDSLFTRKQGKYVRVNDIQHSAHMELCMDFY